MVIHYKMEHMDNINIIRKIKINKLGYYDFNDVENQIFKVIKDNLYDLKKMYLYTYDYYFYFKNTELIFYYDPIKNNIRMNSSFIYQLFFNIVEDDKLSDKIILDVIEYIYKIKTKTIYYICYYSKDNIKYIYENCNKNIVNEKIN